MRRPVAGGLDRILLRGLALAAALVLPLAFALDPPDGDLTELGGYAENRFGPKAPQAIFVPPLAEAARVGTGYDVLVFGDGFSRPDAEERHGRYGHYWTDHLRNLTGLTVGVRPADAATLAAQLVSPEFRERPPRVVILQLSESALETPVGGLELSTVTAPRPHGVAAPRPLPVEPLNRQPRSLERSRAQAWNPPPIGHALDLLVKALPRAVLNVTGGPVQERPLAYAGLFSSAAATTTLFRAEDFQPWRADHRLLEERRASLHAIQDAVEANGVTRFLLLVAPDKGTVYADFLLEPPPHRSAVDEVLGADPTLQAVPLAAGLTALAAGGVRDVYAPNGSRWGLEGQLYAARTVARTLGRLGVLTGAADASPDVAILPCRPGQGDCTPTRTQTD
ncbi:MULTISPECIES: alginate O-acetyltransferase AlgX-related protein [Azospirillum]|uniref:AlgX/AlgJ SGNH hydrolase-like domain-containing protein n=1 Tax=Azospirillum brasilense TaxID=192 RepID=A0ABU4PFZ3_AZOBR|nr:MULTISPECIES: hypothetical protein [Azospirillum]MDW7552589.1 hypothetical protein [Azospirillum brasilense]MDW7592219.1 hypothetical protein [Azospirillum brasilense]MDW7627350.1 hypothetical protein [Azospirillum brasilense]MDX5954961.1 hypothetical protein [Azospirillum brasilense]